MGLDQFFGTKSPPPEERCSNPKCHKIIKPTDMHFYITKKAEKKPYCQACYKAIMRPLEEAETL